MGNEVEESFRVVGVPVGEYVDSGFSDIDADGAASRVVQVLVQYGGEGIPWGGGGPRDSSWIEDRLLAWAPPTGRASDADTGSSVLFWVGHGESTGDRAWLATGKTVPFAGVKVHLPEQLAASITRQWRLRQDDPAPGLWSWSKRAARSGSSNWSTLPAIRTRTRRSGSR